MLLALAACDGKDAGSRDDRAPGDDSGKPDSGAADADRDDYGADDRDDADADVHPGAADTPYDGVDQDCDGYADASDTACTSLFTLAFADGGRASFDGCIAWSMVAGFELDPDGPPVIEHLDHDFSAWGDERFECSVAIATGPSCVARERPIRDEDG